MLSKSQYGLSNFSVQSTIEHHRGQDISKYIVRWPPRKGTEHKRGIIRIGCGDFLPPTFLPTVILNLIHFDFRSTSSRSSTSPILIIINGKTVRNFCCIFIIIIDRKAVRNFCCILLIIIIGKTIRNFCCVHVIIDGKPIKNFCSILPIIDGKIMRNSCSIRIIIDGHFILHGNKMSQQNVQKWLPNIWEKLAHIYQPKVQTFSKCPVEIFGKCLSSKWLNLELSIM